jgi:hypothetical protein
VTCPAVDHAYLVKPTLKSEPPALFFSGDPQ